VTLGNRVCGRNADGAADVAEEVKDAAGVAGAFLADGSEGHLGEWDEDHGEADAADSEWARRGCRENVQGKGGEPEAGEAGDAEDAKPPATMYLGSNLETSAPTMREATEPRLRGLTAKPEAVVL
jgi:hypothetical protein